VGAGLTGVEYEIVRRVYVGDDDQSGLIYFATYFRYMAEGDQECFAALGYPFWSQIAAGESGPAVHAACDFVAPARTGDTLRQQIRLLPGASSSCTTEHTFIDEGGVTVARGRIVRAWVDLTTMQTRPLPPWLRRSTA
jgi:YbgC/YbaW family acyl-CoA thioester hydrolase